MSKRPRDDSGAPSLSAADIAEILARGEEIPSLDAAGVKRLVLTLERAVTANAQLRAKYPTEPLKYLDAEARLDAAIKALQGVAAAPEHYGALPASGALATLLGLLGHENSDIMLSVFELLGELLGENDESGAVAEAAAQLVDAIAADGGLELLLQGVARLGGAVLGGGGGGEVSALDADNMARDAEGLVGALELMGRLAALRPVLVLELLRAPPLSACGAPLLLGTLFAQLAPGPFSDVKGAAAELLCDLLAAGGLEAARAVGAAAHAPAAAVRPHSGIECLLEALSVYRKRDPEGAEEKELVCNLFDALCTCLVSPSPPFPHTHTPFVSQLTPLPFSLSCTPRTCPGTLRRRAPS
jgi:beta-catenin-like protein 1